MIQVNFVECMLQTLLYPLPTQRIVPLAMKRGRSWIVEELPTSFRSFQGKEGVLARSCLSHNTLVRVGGGIRSLSFQLL